MKYLKKIFESKVGIDKDELTDFCEMNLAYLLDDGDFRIDIEYFDDLIGQYLIVVRLVKMVELSPGERMTTMYQWQEVKDYIVPFIIQLNKNYKLNTTWNDTKGSITIRQQQEWRNFSYEKFMRVVDKWYENDDEIKYIEIILDNEILKKI
jgi:hypothetical protein